MSQKSELQQQQPSESEARITEQLAKDRPTIDAAVKSFMSLIVAKAMTASTTDQKAGVQRPENSLVGIVKAGLNNQSTVGDGSAAGPQSVKPAAAASSSAATASTTVQQQALQLARVILKSVNGYTFPIHDTVADAMAEKPGMTEEKRLELQERAIVAKLWNGLVQSEQKPSKYLGRRALRLAWKGMEVQSTISGTKTTTAEAVVTEKGEEEQQQRQQQLTWLSEFESYLFAADRTDDAKNGEDEDDDDSQLIWAADGGQAELSRRRQRRQTAATERGPSTPS